LICAGTDIKKTYPVRVRVGPTLRQDSPHANR
jgi:hypothetical protein